MDIFTYCFNEGGKKIKKFISKWKEIGSIPMLFYLFEQIENKYFEINRFYFLEADTHDFVKEHPLPSDLTVEVHDYSPQLFQKMEDDFDQRNISAVLYQTQTTNDGIKLVTIKDGDRHVAGGYIKVVEKLTSMSDYSIDINRKHVGAWLYGGFVHPDYRKRGLFYILTDEIIKYIKSIGVNKAYCEVHYLNRASLITCRKLGFVVYKNVYYLRFFNKKIFRESKKGYWC